MDNIKVILKMITFSKSRFILIGVVFQEYYIKLTFGLCYNTICWKGSLDKSAL